MIDDDVQIGEAMLYGVHGQTTGQSAYGFPKGEAWVSGGPVRAVLLWPLQRSGTDETPCRCGSTVPPPAPAGKRRRKPPVLPEIEGFADADDAGFLAAGFDRKVHG